jgi:hypothetical protein
MLTATARRRVAALRQPAHAARIARALWIAWAVIVWNVVFDHVIVVAGRSYIVAAELAAASSTYVNMDDWMRPARVRALWVASAAAAAILLTGLAFARLAARANQT